MVEPLLRAVKEQFSKPPLDKFLGPFSAAFDSASVNFSDAIKTSVLPHLNDLCQDLERVDTITDEEEFQKFNENFE